MKKNNLKIFGELEAEIMEIMWRTGSASVRDVLSFLKKKKKIAYTTVMTVMSRLCDKGILNREEDNCKAFIYTPAKDKKTFMQKASAEMIKGFLKEYGDIAVAQFIDIIESSDAKYSADWKNKLRSLIK